MNVTVTSDEATMLRRLADAALQSASPDPSFSPEDVRAFVFGACLRDQPTCGPGYRAAVADMVVDYLNGFTHPDPSASLQHLCRRAEAIFGRPQAQAIRPTFCPDRTS